MIILEFCEYTYIIWQHGLRMIHNNYKYYNNVIILYSCVGLKLYLLYIISQ